MGQDIVFDYRNDSETKSRVNKVVECEKKEHKNRYYHLKSLDSDFRELSRSRSSCLHRDYMSSKSRAVADKNDDTFLKRGSMYQSSEEVRRTRELREGRRKVDYSGSDGAFLSFEIVDSLPSHGSNEAVLLSHQSCSHIASLNAESKPARSEASESIKTKSMEFLDLSFRDLPDKNLKNSPSVKPNSHTADQISADQSVDASPKTRFSPFKKMLDPIMKSKSVRQANGATDPASVRGNAVLSKSLLSDLSKATEKIDSDEPLIREEEVSETASSPVHLHGILKLETENGNPAFEFSVKDPEDVLSAKTWKTDNADTWIYTFHSSKKKNNDGKSKHGRSSPIIGQMQVSCYLCSEMRENGSLANSTVAEFVLYDIAQARRSFAAEERSQCSTDSVQSVSINVKDNSATDAEERSQCTVGNCEAHTSTSCPWSPEDLHPQLETAAIVIQIPFNRTEKLKEVILEDNESLSTSPAADNLEIIYKIVTPSGMHGVPDTDDGGGPSTLLDRWRFGGGCECGGWDMGCPIAVFDKAREENLHKTSESKKPVFLFLQGSKEKIPALSVTADSTGQYSVDFHARFSALQAFSICLSILHTFESSSAAALDQKNRQRFFSNSLRSLLEEEVRQLIEAVAVEKKSKEKRVERIPPSIFLEPPFSPIGRV